MKVIIKTLALLMIVTLFISGCDFESTDNVSVQYPGTPVNNNDNSNTKNDVEEPVVEELENEEIVDETSVEEELDNGCPKEISNKRETTKELDIINLRNEDFEEYVEKVDHQSGFLSDIELKKYDGYECYAIQGHSSVFKYDEDEDYEDPNDLIVSTVIRYKTDYIDQIIKEKGLSSNGQKEFEPKKGEYSIGYYTLDSSSGLYQSVYTVEFVKYDVYAKVIVASKDLIVKKDEVIDYAREVERRIEKIK